MKSLVSSGNSLEPWPLAGVDLRDSSQSVRSPRTNPSDARVPRCCQHTPPIPAYCIDGICRAVFSAAVHLYNVYCFCQPLPLLTTDEVWHAYENGHDELVHAIIALTAPFRDQSAERLVVQDHIKAARAAFVRRVSNGDAELATIQAMILSSYTNLTREGSKDAGVFAADQVQTVPSIERRSNSTLQ